MATSSIHIGNGRGGYFSHNSREVTTSNSIFNNEENYCSHSKNEAFEIYRNELKIRSEKYKERTGQNIQKNVITHLSSIVNFNEDHTPDDIKKVCEHLEQKFDTKVIQFSMHRDEGHVTDDGEIVKNYHAHIEFMGLDSQGKSIKRNLHKKELVELQTEVAELLQMKRGINFNQEFKDFKQGKRDTMPTKAKRLDTYDYKAHKQEENKAVLAKTKDLKAKVAELRAELKAQNAPRADYARLEQQNRELQQRVREKDLTLEELEKQLNTKISEKLEAMQNNQEANKKLIESLETIKKQKATIDTLNQEKSVLKQNMSDLEHNNKSYRDGLDILVKRLPAENRKKIKTYNEVSPEIARYIERLSIIIANSRESNNTQSPKPKSEATRETVSEDELDMSSTRELLKQALADAENQNEESKRRNRQRR